MAATFGEFPAIFRFSGALHDIPMYLPPKQLFLFSPKYHLFSLNTTIFMQYTPVFAKEYYTDIEKRHVTIAWDSNMGQQHGPTVWDKV